MTYHLYNPTNRRKPVSRATLQRPGGVLRAAVRSGARGATAWEAARKPQWANTYSTWCYLDLDWRTVKWFISSNMCWIFLLPPVFYSNVILMELSLRPRTAETKALMHSSLWALVDLREAQQPSTMPQTKQVKETYSYETDETNLYTNISKHLSFLRDTIVGHSWNIVGGEFESF